MTTAGQPGLPWRVLSAWGDLRASIRSLAGSGLTEARLLVIAMLSGLIWFLQSVMLFRLGAEGAGVAPGETTAYFAALFINAIFFRTLMLYAVAGVIGLALRKLGGQGTWMETRAAVFWAFLVTAPVRLALMLLSAVADAGAFAELSLIIAQAGQALLVVVLAIFLAELHKLRAWSIFAGIACVSLIAVALAGLVPQAS